MEVAQREQQLVHERAVLDVAERHIREGSLRVLEQQARVTLLRSRGQDVELAERLVINLRDMLGEWEAHRRLIRGHIALLERQTSGS